LSNLVTSLDAVVWDQAAGTYVLRTFHRADPDGAAFLASLGRAFVTELTLQVGRNSNLRCVSRVDITAEELFAAPGSVGRTFDSFVDAAGRAEAIWFAFTAAPWLKVWSVSPTRPMTSRPVTGPYNYPFSDNVPAPVAALAGRIIAGEHQLAPVFGQAQYTTTAAGLTATASADIWGPSKNLLLYVRPTTIRMHANGYAVLTNRSNIQHVVHEFTTFYQELLRRYADQGRFPVNGAVEIRVTGLDDPGEVDLPGAQPPALSALRPRADHPEWNVAVWLDVLTLPGTAHAERFYRELEQFIFATFAGTRVEWSKGWAYTDEAAWSAPEVLHGRVPASFPDWDRAVATLNRYDPHRVFSTTFLDDLL
jgi:FAD/FMN-containing dehydrogenase